MKKIKVTILGQVYSLVGENERIMKTAAEEVEDELQKVNEKYKNESLQTIYTVTALNIAEKLALSEIQNKTDEEFTIDQLKKIVNYLVESINQ